MKNAISFTNIKNNRLESILQINLWSAGRFLEILLCKDKLQTVSLVISQRTQRKEAAIKKTL